MVAFCVVRQPYLSIHFEGLCGLVVLQWQAAGYLAGGLSFFVGLYQLVKFVDKPSQVPYVSLSSHTIKQMYFHAGVFSVAAYGSYSKG